MVYKGTWQWVTSHSSNPMYIYPYIHMDEQLHWAVQQRWESLLSTPKWFSYYVLTGTISAASCHAAHFRNLLLVRYLDCILPLRWQVSRDQKDNKTLIFSIQPKSHGHHWVTWQLPKRQFSSTMNTLFLTATNEDIPLYPKVIIIADALTIKYEIHCCIPNNTLWTTALSLPFNVHIISSLSNYCLTLQLLSLEIHALHWLSTN